MYTVLDENLQVKGRLSLNNGQGNTTFFSDTITTQMATDNANDPAGLTTVDYTNQDKQGNAKQWSHSLTISVEATDLGTSINTTDYLMYFDSVADHYYLMKVINTSTDRNSGFITVSAINTAIFELGKQLIQAEQTLAQVDLKTFVSKMYKNAPFSLRVADDNLTVIDYVVSANTSLQALLQDLQTKYDIDVDSWVELDETGRIVDRVLYFGHLGSDNGELIRYGGAKGFENMTATEVSDIIYTKLYVTGKTNDKDATKGHIGTVNNGLEYITDDDANQLMYAIGASQQQPVYLEGTITNSLLSEPKALLEWAKQQIGIFNHPRFNYTVSPLHDQIVALGDTVTVQDFHIKPEILVTSKVIQKTVSFASPETNTFVLGEFSSIFTDNMNKSANVINLIKKDVTVVQAAADIAKAQADSAYQQAVLAQEKSIHAQTSADGKTTSYTVDSVQDLPQSANEGDIGWVKLSDGTHMYSYTDGKWVEKINPSMGADIDKKVSDVVTQAKDYSDKAIADNQVKVDASIKSVDDKANQLKQDQSALDTKAQGYANQALSDAKANTAQAVKDVTTNSQKALDQAKTDLTNGIAKEAADRQSAVNALDKTAQGYANQAVAKEVSDRQSAISALDSKTTGAINSARSDAQSALNALQVGGRNYIINSNFYNGTNSWGNISTNWTVGSDSQYTFIQSKTAGSQYLLAKDFNLNTGDQVVISFYAKSPVNGTKLHSEIWGSKYSIDMALTTDWKRYTYKGIVGTQHSLYFWIPNSETDYVQITNVKLESGNMPTAYTQAPEDIVQDYTNRDNQITQSFTQYQQTNDGKVSKAQSDATQSLNLVASKVSQSDYDTKTGDLDTKYNNVKQTVDTQTTEIADIKQTATDQSAKINTISSDVDGTKQSISAIQTKDGQQDARMGTIETSVSGVKSDFSTYKTTNDGAVKTAQTTAQVAVDGLALKVSKTDYDQKTGDLSTKINDVKQTADSSAQTIADMQIADGKQDARMTQIESDASGVKTTVSDISTAQGKQSGDISTLQQRADGFDATVTKINNLSVGARNLLTGTRSFTFSGNIGPNASTFDMVDFNSDTKMLHLTAPQGSGSYAGLFMGNELLKANNIYSFSFDIKGTGMPSSLFGWGDYSSDRTQKGSITSDWSRMSILGTVTKDNSTILLYFNTDNQPLDVYIKLWKIETGNTPTDWTPAPEDVDSATAKAQLTADQATLSINNYKNDADGRISKAQADIITNANAITQKVSQSDYNAKTGDLSTKVSTAQQTADQANTTIGNYQKSNDGRVTSAESAIKQNADNIASKVSQSDYNAKTGQIDSQISTINQNAQAITQTVTQVSDKVDNLQVGGRNYITNSNFHNGTNSWDNTATNWTVGSDSQYTFIQSKTGGSQYLLIHDFNLNEGDPVVISFYAKSPAQGTGLHSEIWGSKYVIDASLTTEWKRYTYSGVVGIGKSLYFWLPDGSTNYAQITNVKLEYGSTLTDWTPAPEDTDSKFSQQQQTIDSINSTVQQQGTNISNVSTRVQTAEGNISTAQNNITGLQSSQKQTADGLSQEVSDRKSGDSTVLQQGKDFTTSQVSNSESNMKSLINQKADSTTIGVIKDDISSLKSNTQWQRVERFDDMNYMMTTGRFFVGASAGTNSAVSASFYIVVDAPQTDRITQTQWKDLDGSLMYRRTYNGSSWSPWTQMVMSSTLLNIFHDSWSLGTTTNDGITKQMVTGIMGQPDGTLILKGNSLILDGNTTVTGDFYAKGGNFQNLNASNIKVGTLDGYQVNIANVNVNNLVGDTISGFNFNVNKQMIIASGGVLKSDVVNMGSNSFYVNSSNIDSTRTSSEGYKVSTFQGSFNISSSQGSVSSSGNISVYNSGQSQPYKNGHYGSEYNGNNILLYAIGYDNNDPNEFLNMSSAQIDISHSSDGLLSNATDKTRIRSNLIETTGTLNAFSGTQTPNVYSYPNLNLESKNQSVVLIAGGKNILQARENGYLYLLNRYSGSGGVSVQMAGDGAFFMQSSATKYKEDIQYDGGTSVGDKFLTLDPATWQDKDEYEQRKLYRETGIEPTHQIHMTDKRYYGLIAEDLVKAGLEEFVVRDEVTGEVNGLEYDKVAISLIPVVREQRDAINELRLEVERLKQK